jgi:hypothetical protein
MPPDVAKLAAQAREAYDQKRTRECIALTKELAQADPGNAEARSLESAVRADIQRDLNDARALLDDARRKPDGHKYRKAAEIILMKTLNLDPGHEEARLLLSNARVSPETAKPVAVFPAPPAAPLVLEQPEPPKPAAPKREPVPFTAPTTPPIRLVRAKEQAGNRVPLISASILVLIIAVVLIAKPWTRSKPAGSESASASTTVSAQQNDAAGATIPPAATPAPLPVAATPVKTAQEPVGSAAAAPAATTPANGTPAPASRPSATIATETGMLAVSSPIAADIYMGDKYLGSTPTTLQLPAGSQTLEYRYKDLRTAATHLVKANETTTAVVNFETVVQINAKPWAQVFVEGTPRKALGQTPLSDVRVALGTVLVFENPNFPSKSHRIVAGDATIQMVFP